MFTVQNFKFPQRFVKYLCPVQSPLLIIRNMDQRIAFEVNFGIADALLVRMFYRVVGWLRSHTEVWNQTACQRVERIVFA